MKCIRCILLVVALLQTIASRTCSRSTDTFVTEQGEGGFTEMILFNGDTFCVPEHLRNRENAPERKGKIVHFHITDDSIQDFFAVEGARVISPHINYYVEDSMYLLIDQKPLDSVLGKYVCFYLSDTDLYYGREYDTVNNHDARVLMMQNSDIHCYWIIRKKTADIYGPLSFDQYLTKKEELGVSKDLKLKYER